jgi:next-to-BRCA1 protein 1
LISITVAELDHCAEASSLASSSIVMPQSAPVRSAAPSEVAVHQTVSMSPVTAASRLTTDYAASDNGSDASSVSLISVSPSMSCSEEAEWEEAQWEDSRSQVLASQPDGSRAGMEYVVLYDENSSDEE